MALTVLTTASFDRIAKKLHSKDKKVLDDAVKEIANNPFIGEEKRGDLIGVFVHKFKLNNQETLLAYELQPDKQNPTEFVLMSVGSHENFYTQLKRSKNR
jgi:mRNA-degrading endonuclease RelE of RelBE toxin-antitoxin system